MSSILNALKKVEEESIQASGLEPRIRQKPGAGDRLRFFLADRMIGLALAIGLIGLGAGGFWAYTAFESVPAPKQTASIAESEPPAAPTAIKANRPKATTEKASPAPPAAKPKTPPPAVSAAPADTKAPAPAMRTPAPPLPPAAARNENPTPLPPARRHRVSDTRTFAGTTVTRTAPEPDRVPVLEDSGLTLQAISWANRPDSRIAVINGKICREGEKIDGFVIQEINPDDIRVSDGSSTWRLMFKIK